MVGKQQEATAETPGPAVALVSLGCAKNLVESEVMLADLAQSGLAITGDYADADVIVVNTCGFLHAAQHEAGQTIDQLVRHKTPHGRCQCLVVAGCWSQIASDEILHRWPEVDLVIGVNDRHRLLQAVAQVLETGHRLAEVSSRPDGMPAEDVRFRLTPRHWAYLRISEGCSQRCTFCTIPQIRGPYRSKPPTQVLREARQLIDSGVKELVLIGQETTNYGHDLNMRTGLATLLGRLDKLPGIDWIRLMYTYPANFDDSVIEAIASLPRVVKYVDVPLQHVNDRILRLMGRRIDRETMEKLFAKLRRSVPGIAIRTTMIVGFPSEQDRDFDELVRFVKDFQFDALGTFAFSPEPGTRAAAMEGQIDPATRDERRNALMRTQRTIAAKKATAWIGKRFPVYVESVDPRHKVAVARHSRQAPEVDPVTLIDRAVLEALSAGPGARVQVQCTGTRGYDLVAKPVRRGR